MTEFLMLVITVSALCFMGTCLVLVCMAAKRNDDAEEQVRQETEEETQMVRDLLFRQEQDLKALDEMNRYTGAPIKRDGDIW